MNKQLGDNFEKSIFDACRDSSSDLVVKKPPQIRQELRNCFYKFLEAQKIVSETLRQARLEDEAKESN